VVCVISAGLSAHLKRPVEVAGFTIFVGVLAWVMSLRFEREKVPVYFKIIGISALAVCIFGLYQFFGDLLGLPVSLTGLRTEYTAGVFGFPRIQSTGLEPLYFADYLLVPAGLMIAAAVTGYRRWFALGTLTPVAMIVWLTVSRGAMVALALALLVGIGAAALKRRWKPAGLLFGSAVVSMVLAYGLLYVGTHYVVRKQNAETKQAVKNFQTQQTNISNGESSEGRTITRDLAIKAFESHVLLGIGPGAFGAYAAKEMPDRFSGDTAIVNNEPLEILAETGILGALALGAFLVYLVRGVVKAPKPDRPVTVLAYGLLLALGAITLQYQLFSTLYITHIWVVIGLLGGIMAIQRPGKRKA
jgi:O-antigen ligase